MTPSQAALEKIAVMLAALIGAILAMIVNDWRED